MSDKRTDRRIEKTYQVLRQALMELIVEKGYEAITVQDITDRANVARTTFYLHFRDKDELLFEGMRDIYDQLLGIHQQHHEHLRLSANMQKLPAFDADDFQHVAQYAEFYRTMLSKKGSIKFIVDVQRYLAQVMEAELRRSLPATAAKMPDGLVGYLLAGLEIGAISWWLATGMQQSPQQMAEWFARMIVGGTQELFFPTLELTPSVNLEE